MMLITEWAKNKRKYFALKSIYFLIKGRKTKKLYILPKIETFRVMLETSTNMW